jgi:uncharacterized protein (TIGR02145 family)
MKKLLLTLMGVSTMITALFAQAPADLEVCALSGYALTSTADAVGEEPITYEWFENGVPLPESNSATYSIAAGEKVAGDYAYWRVAANAACTVSSNTYTVRVYGTGPNVPESPVNFTAFNPCPDAATGTVWYLTDTRTGGNNNTYKVKKMADGRIWMVQDLKFGTCPNSLARWYDATSPFASTHKPTVFDGYLGHCRSSTYTNTGYLYSWPAAMQSSLASLYQDAISFACSGQAGGTVLPAPGACQGICPAGWHVPTGAAAGEFADLFNATTDCPVPACAYADNIWEGALGGRCTASGELTLTGTHSEYWTSTPGESNLYATEYRLYANQRIPFMRVDCYRTQGLAVRCVMNY